MRSSWLEIDLDALRFNVEYIRSFMKPETKMLIAVKGNAYGHGAVRCSKLFEEMGVEYLGVAIPEEGVELRRAGIKLPILIFGYTFDDSYDLLFDYDLVPNVFTMEQAAQLNALAAEKGKKLTIHVSVDTGLSRLGFSYNDMTVENILAVTKMENLHVEGIFSMFAAAYGEDDAYAKLQFSRFKAVCDELKEKGADIKIRHMCDSGATYRFPEMHLDMVRPGTSVFGQYCFDWSKEKPVMSVKSRLASIRTIEEGTKVGYGCTYTAAKTTVVGVVPCGFVDGTSRLASNKGHVLLHGVRCPIIGRVCMDQMMIDITEVDAPKIGDEIVLCGTQNGVTISQEDAGNISGTSDTEYVCRQSRRMPLVYLEGGKVVDYVSYLDY
ncbi:MAG: alanine racemase [Clostridiales bacterium]|nr:alanine racemase [Clostridiales bacterium]